VDLKIALFRPRVGLGIELDALDERGENMAQRLGL